MKENPLISVILPVFNSELYLAEAIDSVINQTYQPIEIICIDDGSSDNSLSLLKSYGKKIIIIESAQNCGIAETRNKGIRIAKGEYIALMDADDIWKPEKISKQMEQFQSNPGLDISFTYLQCFLSPNLPDDVKRLRYVPPNPMPGYVPATAMIKMSSFKKVGEFDKKWKISEFIDWFARAKTEGLTYAMVSDILHLRRIHQSNTGVMLRNSRSDYVKVIKEALDRKRRLRQ